MTRCPHCKKITHSEDLIVYYDIADQDKICELVQMADWTPPYLYSRNDEHFIPNEYGKLKCGDIYIHFRIKTKCS